MMSELSCTFIKWPRMASIPAGMATSWNNVIRVIQPYFHELIGRDAFRNANAI